jgi:hypothetical protein
MNATVCGQAMSDADLLAGFPCRCFAEKPCSAPGWK